MNPKQKKKKKQQRRKEFAYYFQYFGKSLEQKNLTIEDLRPNNIGGFNSLKNLRLSCFECNNNKGNILRSPSQEKHKFFIPILTNNATAILNHYLKSPTFLKYSSNSCFFNISVSSLLYKISLSVSVFHYLKRSAIDCITFLILARSVLISFLFTSPLFPYSLNPLLKICMG